MDTTLTRSHAPARLLGRAGGLRRRLLIAFVLVSVLPVLTFALVLSRHLVADFEARADARLNQVLARVSEELAARRILAEARLAMVAERLPGIGSAEIAALARDAELPVLEVVDDSGRIVASHHWAAGVGLPDEDGLFPDPAAAFRLERVAEGYGVGRRLALLAQTRTRLPGHEQPLTLRGGDFVDGPFLSRLSALLGVDLALRDEARGRWIAPEGSPLGTWPDPAGAGGGLPETYHRVFLELTPGLRLVAASPQAELEAALARVRFVTGVTALGALAVALGAGLWLSQRVASPVLALAEAARRISRGEPGAAVPEGGGDEVAQLGHAFNRMTRLLAESRERLIQAERVAAWREMARRLAHELKNPLFPIQLSIETLRRVHERRAPERADPEFDALLTESTDTIVSELGALRAIVDEFSQFARMPRPHLTATDVRRTVERVLTLYATPAQGVRLDVRLDEDVPEVAADRDLLARAIGNLVKNALEAMPRGGTLHVAVTRRDEAVVVSVEDTGPGLDESQRTRLFTPDYTTKEGGTGLGLAIVQGIVSDHGGRIEVETRPGAGTRFSIVLPAPPLPADVRSSRT